MKVRATFIGKDGSRGYRTGQTYDLVLDGNKIIEPTPCPYGSVEAFLRNWMVKAVLFSAEPGPFGPGHGAMSN